MQILIVEDDDTLRRALCDTIELGGYRVINKSTARGIRRPRSERDRGDYWGVQMPEMDGTVAARRATAQSLAALCHDYYPGSVRHAVKAMRHGATDYLQKPFEAQVLLDLVSRMGQLPGNDDGEMLAEPHLAQLIKVFRRVATVQRC